MRNYKMVVLDSRDLIEALNGGIRVVVPELPVDALIDAAHYDFERDCFMIRATHHSFPSIQPGTMIPTLEAIGHEVTCECSPEKRQWNSVTRRCANCGHYHL